MYAVCFGEFERKFKNKVHNGKIKRLQLYSVLIVCMGLFSNSVFADDFAISVQRAALDQQSDWYVLDADIDFQLSSEAKQALRNSIALNWEMHLEVYKQRPLIWDEVIIDLSLQYQIRYHALLNMYQIKQNSTGSIVSFTSLSSALQSLGIVRGLKAFKKEQLEFPGTYYAALKLQFMKENLPLPLRPISYFTKQWYLSSDWFRWPIQIQE